MANQPQPRPWFRLSTLARPAQPPAPAPAPRAQTQPPAAPLPRPTMIRPTFRPPTATQPQPAQGANPPAPRAPAPPPSAPSPAAAQSPPTPTVVSPPSPPTPRPAIATTPAGTAPGSLVAQKSPSAPKSPPVSTRLSSPPSLPSSPKPKVQAPPPSIPSSPALKQAVPRSSPASPLKASSPSPPSKPSSPSPPPKPSSPSPPPKPSSPSSKQVIFSMPTYSTKPSNGLAPSDRSPPVTAPMPASAASPRAAKPLPETPPQSPKIKPALSPPSPYALPPSQLESVTEHERRISAEAEQKTVLHVQETAGKARSFLDSYDGDVRKAHTGMHVKPKGREIHKKTSDSDDIGMRVITIAGENKGAIMELGYSPKRHDNPHGSSVTGHRKFRSNGESSDNLRGNDDRSKMHGRGHDARAKPSTPMHTFMNSNVQGINSSIVFNSTCSHHDPGVHLSLTRKPFNGAVHSNQLEDHANGRNIFQKEEDQK